MQIIEPIGGAVCTLAIIGRALALPELPVGFLPRGAALLPGFSDPAILGVLNGALRALAHIPRMTLALQRSLSA